MKHGVTYCLLLSVALVFQSFVSYASVTNEDVVVELIKVADNSVTTNIAGWTLNKIGKYPSNPVLQFNADGDWILSPEFVMPILKMEFGVRCSDSVTRRLIIADESTGAEVRRFSLCAAGNTDETQSFDFATEEGLRQFRLKINKDGGSTGLWGIGRMVVVTASPACAPTGLAVVRTNANYCVLAWGNGANTISNRVDTFLVERGAGEDVIFNTGFDGFDRSNPDISNKDLSGRLATLLNDARISGERVYAADGTNGVCQIGTTEKKGFLRFSGVSNWSNVELRLVLKKHDYSGDANKMQFAWETDVETNMFKEIAISTEFAKYVVDLSTAQPQVPPNASVVIGYFSTVGGNRRVLIDSLSIVNLSADMETQVDSRFISAAPGPVSFRVPFDLEPKAEYRFSVCALNGDGILSGEASVEVTASRPQGTVYSLR